MSNSNLKKSVALWASTLVGAIGINALVVSSALASGFGAGNGGGVVYCPGSQQEVMLIDFWESEAAREEYALLRALSGVLTVERLLDEALNGNGLSYARDFGRNALRDEVQYVMAELAKPENAVPPQHRLIYPAEALPPFLPEGCEFRPVASYQQNQRIFYDAALLEKVKQDPVQFAGLVLHEALYRFARDFTGLSNSQAVRPYVPAILSGLPVRFFGTNAMSVQSSSEVFASGLVGPARSRGDHSPAEWRLRLAHDDEDRYLRLRFNYWLTAGLRPARCDVRFVFRDAFGQIVEDQVIRLKAHTTPDTDDTELHTYSYLQTHSNMRRFRSRVKGNDYFDFMTHLKVRDLKQSRYSLEVTHDCSRYDYLALKIYPDLDSEAPWFGDVGSMNSHGMMLDAVEFIGNVPDSLQVQIR